MAHLETPETEPQPAGCPRGTNCPSSTTTSAAASGRSPRAWTAKASRYPRSLARVTFGPPAWSRHGFEHTLTVHGGCHS